MQWVLCLIIVFSCGCAARGVAPVSVSAVEPSMNNTAIHLSWFFTAPPEKVWATWTKADAVRQWFGSDPLGHVISAELAPLPGGRFEVTFEDKDGTRHTASGVYQQVEPYHLLSFTWGWKSEPGIETQITIELSRDGDGTRMEFVHAGLVHASSHDYDAGWRRTFEKFAQVLAADR